MIFATHPISEFMAIANSQTLIYVGVGLVLFAATVFHAAVRKELSKAQVRSVIVQDWAWVVGSALVLIGQPWSLSQSGYWVIALVALAVADFAFFQMRFLRRLSIN